MDNAVKRKGRISKNCVICGKEFSIPYCWRNRVASCSWKCRNVNMSGKRNPNYKNGKTKSPYGYILINQHPRKIFEHRLVMEKHLGRKLKSWEEESIHHINGDKADNRVENLKIMTRSEHRRLHANISERDEGGRFISNQQWFTVMA